MERPEDEMGNADVQMKAAGQDEEHGGGIASERTSPAIEVPVIQFSLDLSSGEPAGCSPGISSTAAALNLTASLLGDPEAITGCKHAGDPNEIPEEPPQKRLKAAKQRHHSK
ncbi:hypothetical protein M422DRAFT_49335 [Sphaerobolus stellatus SS14]|uniref:Uncharacterized protein n=1 Tax=Sphaerobolus stellatus (strain SS14) TaxID=990650 RepID=A0A0C9VFI9_SPHS4|nr:hypothetical protein M422DRAFT_49335 [Sphaerobolus stellatus SS14]